jgi:hypothetical protein
LEKERNGCEHNNAGTHLYAWVKDKVAIVQEHEVNHDQHGEQNCHRQLQARAA